MKSLKKGDNELGMNDPRYGCNETHFFAREVSDRLGKTAGSSDTRSVLL